MANHPSNTAITWNGSSPRRLVKKSSPSSSAPFVVKIKWILLFLVGVCAFASFLFLETLHDHSRFAISGSADGEFPFNDQKKKNIENSLRKSFPKPNRAISFSAPSTEYFTGDSFRRIRQLEKSIGVKLNHKVFSCRRLAINQKNAVPLKRTSQSQNNNFDRANTYNDASNSTVDDSANESLFFDEQDRVQYRYSSDIYAHPSCNLQNFEDSSEFNGIIIYNPSNRDRYLCGGKILIGPQKWKKLDTAAVTTLRGCWKTVAIGGATQIQTSSTWRVHSFPYAPTVKNIAQFPGIIIARSIHALDNTFSGLSNAQSVSKYERFHGCNVKCYHEKGSGIVGSKYVYGTDWMFIYSMEGQAYYPNLKIDKNAWKRDQFYSTTSFQSEVPLPYYSRAEYDIQKTPAVPFSTGIKGASFLARNCGSKSRREAIVQKLMSTKFRVDALSSCLHNADPQPGWNMKNKKEIMGKYLFHLSFENQITDDYITEKLWGALESGAIPVYLGAPNVKDHVPFQGVIFVDDFPTIDELADYLIKVSNDQQLYESYHKWRNTPLPQEFHDKYDISFTHSRCRYCRWAHSRKYGLGWNHTQQTIEPPILSRETCVDATSNSPLKHNLLKSPAVESWWFYDGVVDKTTQLTAASLNGLFKHISCPLSEDTVAVSKIGPESLVRSIWSNDGTTDIYVEGEISMVHYLNLEFPIRNHHPLQVHNPHTLWVQDDKNRISIIFDKIGINSLATVRSGDLSLPISPQILPLRIRIIVENQDSFHEGANNVATYFGHIMEEDILKPPELFFLTNEPVPANDRSLDFIIDEHSQDVEGTATNKRKKMRKFHDPSRGGVRDPIPRWRHDKHK